MLVELGKWLERRYTHGICDKAALAWKDIEACGHSIEFLRAQWALQKAAQLSQRARKSRFSYVLICANGILRRTKPFKEGA